MQIPRLPIGKIDERRLRELAAEMAEPPAGASSVEATASRTQRDVPAGRRPAA
jgi:hypothetical protein